MRRTGAILACAVCWLLLAGPALAQPGVTIGIPGVPGPPVIAIPAGPAMVVIPGTSLYFAPGLEPDVFFYQGHWWTPHEGHWFRSQSYSGPWVIVQPLAIFVNLPPGYRQSLAGQKPMPYGQFQRHRKAWQYSPRPPAVRGYGRGKYYNPY